MATIELTRRGRGHRWANMGANDDGTPVFLPGGAVIASVRAGSGAGTGIRIQASLDGETDWFDIMDTQGNSPVTLASDSVVELSTAWPYLRPLAAADASGCDVDFRAR